MSVETKVERWLLFAVVCGASGLPSSIRTTHACDAPTAAAPVSFQTEVRTAEAVPTAVQTRRVDQGCLVDAAKLSEPTWKNAALIDMRLPDDLPEYPVPGALVISRNDLTDALLRAMPAPVVLIGAGFDDAVLVNLCQTLAVRSDHPIAVLRGGLPVWRQRQGLAIPDEDRQLSEPQLQRLLSDPRSVVWVLEGGGFVVDTALLGGKAGIRVIAPRQWRRQRARMLAQDVPQVLLASDEAVARWRLPLPSQVWRYPGDVQRLANWRHQQQAALAARDRRLRDGCVWNAH